MNDVIQLGAGGNLITVGGSIAAALITLALTLPKILNAIKSDRIDGNVLTRLGNLETKVVAQDAKIHRYAVRVTKLTLLVLKLHDLLQKNKVELPQAVIDEIVELTEETEEDNP